MGIPPFSSPFSNGFRTFTFGFAGGQPAITGADIPPNLIIDNNVKIIQAYINAKTAPSGAALIVDILAGGSSIWASNPSNRLQLAANATTGNQVDFDTINLSKGQLLTLNVAQIGSSFAGQDVVVQLVCKVMS